MRSMTGFGSVEVPTRHARIRIEVSSVNKRGLEVIVFTPGDLARLERQVREDVAEAVARGKVTVAMHIEAVTDRNGRALDLGKAEAYAAELKKAGKKLGVEGGPSWSDLLGLPGVVVSTGRTVAPAEDRKILDGVRRAVKKMVESREREGARMVGALRAHLRKMEGIRKKMERAAGEMRRKQGQRICGRIRELAGEAGVVLDPERVVREVASAADRGDVTEELGRLRAHLLEAQGLASTRAPGGRTLEFLIQELQREVNTVGSKSGDLGLTRLAISFKSELEKLREQAANLE
ncbi:MAG: YicC family protein [Verrucomicrobia bacterium]|nr:YicC family protein [Pseudomonadota bacterium]NBS78696.1 YicC family protein [bacterium]NBT23349.1 YicC family protein [bacterium]NBV96116.1 YicC family protein [Verrucomicrobiota bacterium]NBY66506.1 YicC family protein [Verrucomicrobiota bacterium]